MKPDLVFGASGYIGTNLVEFLLDEGRRVRASSRTIEVLQGRGWDRAELCEADALEPASLDAALSNVDTAYYLVHSMAAGKSFPEIDAEAARNFAAAAARQDVRRIIYLGGLTPDDPQSAHLRSREETGDILRAGGVPVTELRAGMIVGPGSAAWEVIRDLVNHLPVMVTPRWVFSRSTPIALSNLLRYLADVPKHEETAGQVYDVAGPDVLTYKEIMVRYGNLVGKRPVIVPVPVLTPRLSSYWLRLVTAVPTNLARALIDGLSQDVVARDQRLASLIPQELLGFDAAAAAALEADRQHALPAHWAEGATHCEVFDPAYSFYAKQAEGSAVTQAQSADIWAFVVRIGNAGDFFYARSLWWLRRAIDWLVGGPSFRRRRRHPAELRVGDVVDSWRVIALEPEKRLTLLMEMKAPGAGVLEFTIDDTGGERRISVHAYWHPAGVWGLLYWYLTLPAHRFIFDGTARTIARNCEQEK
ncbi:MAG: SDR family oxidoreductase [Gammaproteobacteria bacterium]|nr:SDR family oxidoreductase [Gammaproteobacteria bacterium]NNF50113.1 DUF2867 domain-containing protein [Woeseiaceae bacterium]MBT8095287.1 SDR family oxidoreductase [Gammaproteobacteria bacterium]MBT8106260.1 SDR family oxidoreductase [Gammaproteobacteria bacterium]NNK26274.1 DUF2867 domain-containing protein [Woeseiaceae bacterium]